jgi:type II secretory pathway pseudopilin PulG
MEGIILLVLLIIGGIIALAVWLIARAVGAKQSIDELQRRLGSIESEVARLKGETARAPVEAPVPPEMPGVAAIVAAEAAPRQPTPPSAQPVPPPIPPERVTVSPAPPPIPGALEGISAPPPLPSIKPVPRPAPEPARPFVPAINWEQFMGVKLLAWIGGLAAFLAVAFFVKYSFDNDLISPKVRMAIGFIAGLGLLVGGVVLSRKDYAVLAHTLCGTGVVILYAVTFACRGVYHFEYFTLIATFALMVLITAAAFFLAIRLNAMVVAILGMLGGFLTPILLSTGQDNPFGLFGYIAILDAGLILVAVNRRWMFLVTLAAAGTILMQIGWAGEFFSRERYFEGNKILIALGVLLGFNVLYLAAAWWAKQRSQLDWWLAGAKLGLAATALIFAAWFLSFERLAQRPWLMFSFVFLVDLCVAALVVLDKKVALAQPLAGLAVAGLLALWTGDSLTNDLLNAGLTFYLVLAILHSVFPVWLQRRRGVSAAPWQSQLFPPLALVLVLIPIFKLTEISFVVWPIVLLVDVLAIGLAVLTASLLSVLAVLLLTLAATGALISKIPETLTGLPAPLFLIGAFAVFFVMVGVWLTRKFAPEALTGNLKLNDDFTLPGNIAAQLPILSAVLPFLLLIMVTLRLPLTNPSPVFGLALLLVVLMLGVTRLFSLDWMPAVGLCCVAALETTWHFNRFDPANPVRPLIWYLVFLAVFSLYPFLFLRQFSGRVVPWAAAAMAGPLQFFLVHRLVKAGYPNEVMGLLPAAFALPSLLSLIMVVKKVPAATKARMTQLAWFGGVALFFVTLIFPIQFERQWITIGWALEGAALLWLFHRVPHAGLRLAGAGLLVAAFVRLALNPAVFDYHPRSATAIVNWYLYAYGIVTVCLFAGAWLLAPPRHQILRVNAPPILIGLGTVLAFLLMNIEIADYFSDQGSTLTFQFSGSFARDMTYSIAWSVFALVLLVSGIARRIRPPRYAGLGLLGVTILKLFFHDLASLDQLYRIGAFVAVAAIAMLASFAYQRFYATSVKESPETEKQPKA